VRSVTTSTQPSPRVAPPPLQREARLRALVDAHLDTVWRALKRLGVPDAGADDATQEVFIVAARRLDEIEHGRERGYLLGIALRVAADARRALRRRSEVPLDEVGEVALAGSQPAAGAAEVVLDQQRARQALAAALALMPDELREAFVLFEIEELTAPEAAVALGIPVGTIASRVRRARDFIRAQMARKGATP
jgi:RNA polymerase sigma-70 factor, ECF subfamily